MPDNRLVHGPHLLPGILRSLRQRRGLGARDVARAMPMPLRSYQHFESGRGRLVVARIHRFAAVTDTDPYAILLALELGVPRLALQCADNKFVRLITLALQAFDAADPDRISRLDALTLMAAVSRMFDDLAAHARAQDAAAAHWLAARAQDGGPAAPNS